MCYSSAVMLAAAVAAMAAALVAASIRSAIICTQAQLPVIHCSKLIGGVVNL